MLEKMKRAKHPAQFEVAVLGWKAFFESPDIHGVPDIAWAFKPKYFKLFEKSFWAAASEKQSFDDGFEMPEPSAENHPFGAKDDPWIPA